jgi:hypothetical protein
VDTSDEFAFSKRSFVGKGEGNPFVVMNKKLQALLEVFLLICYIETLFEIFI